MPAGRVAAMHAVWCDDRMIQCYDGATMERRRPESNPLFQPYA